MKGFKKSDVEFHRLGYGHTRAPAVNVKVRGDIERVPLADFPGLTKAWLEEFQERSGAAERLDQLFAQTCEMGWEQLQAHAEEIWGRGVKVYAEGRSGGWAWVQGVDPDVDAWDAVALDRWARFSRRAEAEVQDIPYQMAWCLYHDVFLPEQEARLSAENWAQAFDQSAEGA